MLRHRLPLYLITFVLLLNCSKNEPIPTVSIGMNPWPGYECLYLASQKGFFEDAGIKVRIVQYSSLADVQRAFMQNRIDGMASTLIETTVANHLTRANAKVILATDYSHGADMIVGGEGVTSIKDLRGKRVGLEVISLGIFMLARALELNDMSLDDVEIHNIELAGMEQALDEKRLDAVVTYALDVGDMLAKDRYHKIFDSSQIPKEVVDVVSIHAPILEQNPKFVAAFRAAWDRALDYHQQNQEETIAMMAAREQATPQQFKQTMAGIRLLKSSQQQDLFQPGGLLDQTMDTVERVLQREGVIPDNRPQKEDVYRGY